MEFLRVCRRSLIRHHALIRHSLKTTTQSPKIMTTKVLLPPLHHFWPINQCSCLKSRPRCNRKEVMVKWDHTFREDKHGILVGFSPSSLHTAKILHLDDRFMSSDQLLFWGGMDVGCKVDIHRTSIGKPLLSQPLPPLTLLTAPCCNEIA